MLDLYGGDDIEPDRVKILPFAPPRVPARPASDDVEGLGLMAS